MCVYLLYIYMQIACIYICMHVYICRILYIVCSIQYIVYRIAGGWG